MSRKQYGRMLVVAVIAGLVGGMVSSQLFMGVPAFAQKTPQQTKVILAEAFVVVDKDGTPRAVLGVADGTVGLEIVQKGGKLSVIKLGLSPDGAPSLTLSDKEGNRRAMLHVTSDGEPRLTLAHRKELGALMSLSPDGGAALWMYSSNGKGRLAIDVGPDGNSSVNLYDKGGNGRAVLGYTELEHPQTGEKIKRPVSSLILWDKDGKVLWKAP